MTDKLKSRITGVMRHYLTSYGLGIDALRAELLAVEVAQYVYLPDSYLLLLVGYVSTELGVYQHACYAEPATVYKIRVLSQTSMVLLFRDARFVAGKAVYSDEELAAFLLKYQFPAPLSLCE